LQTALRSKALSRLRELGISVLALMLLSIGNHISECFAQPQEYLLGAGDILSVTVFKNPDLTSTVRVSEAGSIGFPLIGAVHVEGLTLQGAEKKIAQMLKDGGFVLDPQVNILVTQSVANEVAALGQVNKPGRYPIEAAGGHLSGLLAAAGGIAPTGADIVTITGLRNGKPFHRDIDTIKMSQSGTDEDIALAGGDTVFVNRAPQFYIYGQVEHPGEYRLERGMTVMQAISAGGGLTGKGSRRGVVLHRRDANGKTKEVGVALEDEIRADDVIYIKERLF
jgi:polysaccharide export outer membrane protein